MSRKCIPGRSQVQIISDTDVTQWLVLAKDYDTGDVLLVSRKFESETPILKWLSREEFQQTYPLLN